MGKGSTAGEIHDLSRCMSKTFRSYSPRQSLLLPQSPMDWLPGDHLAYFVLDVVEALELRPIFAKYEQELRGQPPYHPQMMVALLLYAYCSGVFASRRIERRVHEDIAFRVLAGGQQPDHTAISEFRRIHLEELKDIFSQVLALCAKAGLVKLGHVALDGTKVKANASKHKAMSYERMTKQEHQLRDQVAHLMAAAEQADAEDDARYGKGKRGNELPEELRRAETRLKRIQEAKAALEEEARAARAVADEQKADAKKKDDDEPPSPGPSDLPSHQVPSTPEGDPTPKAQRNFTDPQSRIQKDKDGFLQGYNAQIAVDEANQVIVAEAVTNQPPDVEHFKPMLEQTITNCGDVPNVLTADAGYYSEENVAHAFAWGVDSYLATGRSKHAEGPAPSVRGRPPDGLTTKEWMARRLRTKKGAAAYARRKATVEPVFGQIKQARGFRQFLLRGVEKVRGEWSLICATHNLLKLYAAGRATR